VPPPPSRFATSDRSWDSRYSFILKFFAVALEKKASSESSTSLTPNRLSASVLVTIAYSGRRRQSAHSIAVSPSGWQLRRSGAWWWSRLQQKQMRGIRTANCIDAMSTPDTTVYTGL